MTLEMELRDMPDYGNHMTIEKFVVHCKNNTFTDYDGYGEYATESQVSDIMVQPSDVENIRADFSHVVWYNR